MAKFRVLGLLPVQQIAKVVPTEYRFAVERAVRNGGEFVVVLFRKNRSAGGVNTSTTVQRALLRLPTDAPLLVVGRDFTEEATTLLQERGAAIARLVHFGWTDEAIARHE